MTALMYTPPSAHEEAKQFLLNMTTVLRALIKEDAKTIAQICDDAGIPQTEAQQIYSATGDHATYLSLTDIARVLPGLTSNTAVLDKLVMPTADAGPDQTVASGAVGVALDGTGSTGIGTLTYAWTQTAGAAVTLSDATVAGPTFTAPTGPDTLVFSLVVTDPGLDATDGIASRADTVTINVSAP